MSDDENENLPLLNCNGPEEGKKRLVHQTDPLLTNNLQLYTGVITGKLIHKLQTHKLFTTSARLIDEDVTSCLWKTRSS